MKSFTLGILYACVEITRNQKRRYIVILNEKYEIGAYASYEALRHPAFCILSSKSINDCTPYENTHYSLFLCMLPPLCYPSVVIAISPTTNSLTFLISNSRNVRVKILTNRNLGAYNRLHILRTS